MLKDYDTVNENLKRIRRVSGRTIDNIASTLNYENNCIVTGGKDITFQSGRRIPNRKLVLEEIIKQLIEKANRSVVVFYKSPFLINRLVNWLQDNGIKRKYSIIGNLRTGTEKRLAPFKNMSNEEILYTIREMSGLVNIPFDQYAETYLEYLLCMIEKIGYSVSFENIMTLIGLSNEKLSGLAEKNLLTTESKYFAKTNNGSEIVKRVLKELNNYLKDYYTYQEEDNYNKVNICSEVMQNNVIFIEVGDQYHTEILEYFCNELRCCSKRSPYVVFDDIMLKNNPNFEDYLLKSTGVRFFISAVDIATMISQENFEDFLSQSPTKILLHYDNAIAAEKVTSSVGYYYHMKVSEETSKNRETFHVMPGTVSDGRSVTEEKRLIIEGTNLIELNENQMYLINTAYCREFYDGIRYR